MSIERSHQLDLILTCLYSGRGSSSSLSSADMFCGAVLCLVSSLAPVTWENVPCNDIGFPTSSILFSGISWSGVVFVADPENNVVKREVRDIALPRASGFTDQWCFLNRGI